MTNIDYGRISCTSDAVAVSPIKSVLTFAFGSSLSARKATLINYVDLLKGMKRSTCNLYMQQHYFL